MPNNKLENNEQANQAKTPINKLSDAFGHCMDQIGYELTAEVLAGLLLLSVKASKKPVFKHKNFMGNVTVEMDISPELRGQGKEH